MHILCFLWFSYKNDEFCTFVESRISWYLNHTGYQLVIFVYKKENPLSSVHTPIQLVLPHRGQVQWGVFINIWGHHGGERPKK